MNEEKVRSQIEGKFPSLAGKVRIDRVRRMSIDIDLAEFRPVLEFAAKQLDFDFINTITGQDEGDNLTFMYHITSQSGVVLTIKTAAPKSDPTIRTITDIFPSAEYYEREMIDLLGAKVEGLKKGDRYPLTDDWPQDVHPLRKDWKTGAFLEGGHK